MININKIINFIITLSLVLILVYGGLGTGSVSVSYLAFAYSLVLSIYVFNYKKKLEIPGNFFLYVLFLVILIVHSVFMNGKPDLVLLFLSGGALWFSIDNYRNYFVNKIPYIITSLGLFYFILWLSALLIRSNQPAGISIYFPAVQPVLHSQIGDYWSLVLTVAVYNLLKYKKNKYILFIPLGIPLLAYSYSRTAYISLAAAIFFISYKMGISTKNKKLITLVVILTVLLFLYAGSKKSILLSRPYFFQAITGTINNPLGNGLGRFAEVSQRTRTESDFLAGQSVYSHNIFLEVIVGLGVFSLPFIWFLLVNLKDLLSGHKRNILFSAIFLNLFVNFQFNYSYVIPTMFWLWIISLSFVDPEKRQTKL